MWAPSMALVKQLVAGGCPPGLGLRGSHLPLVVSTKYAFVHWNMRFVPPQPCVPIFFAPRALAAPSVVQARLSIKVWLPMSASESSTVKSHALPSVYWFKVLSQNSSLRIDWQCCTLIYLLHADLQVCKPHWAQEHSGGITSAWTVADVT